MFYTVNTNIKIKGGDNIEAIKKAIKEHLPLVSGKMNAAAKREAIDRCETLPQLMNAFGFEMPVYVETDDGGVEDADLFCVDGGFGMMDEDALEERLKVLAPFISGVITGFSTEMMAMIQYDITDGKAGRAMMTEAKFGYSVPIEEEDYGDMLDELIDALPEG